MSVRKEVRGQTWILVIDRPDVRNALDAITSRRLSDLVREADSADDVRAVVLTGAGDKAFCAGMDLKAGRGEGWRDHLDVAGGFGGLTRARYRTPIIAAVNGVAAGGGFELALACDLIVAASHATFALPEVKRGRLASGGGIVRLAEFLPPVLANEITLLGRPVTAQRAYEMGVINAVVPATELMASALGLAEDVAANAPLAVAGSKEILSAIREPSPETWDLNMEVAGRVRDSEDAIEGSAAFAERRDPVWRGR